MKLAILFNIVALLFLGANASASELIKIKASVGYHHCDALGNCSIGLGNEKEIEFDYDGSQYSSWSEPLEENGVRLTTKISVAYTAGKYHFIVTSWVDENYDDHSVIGEVFVLKPKLLNEITFRGQMHSLGQSKALPLVTISSIK